MTTLVHLSDLHFGRDADLQQITAIETGMASLDPTAIVLSGDLTQRARHGELQCALGFVERLAAVAPVLVVPGNHDIEWWLSPLDIAGSGPRSAKFRRYFGQMSPTLELPGMTITSALTSHGVTWKSLTWKFWRDTAVKGHLPRDEIDRVRERFGQLEDSVLKVLVLHHNVLRGQISRRMGLARWRTAQRRLADCGADLILCGHDHQEGAARLGEGVVVSTAGTHTSRSRGGHPSVFNLIRVSEREICIEHRSWDAPRREFIGGEARVFARGGTAR